MTEHARAHVHGTASDPTTFWEDRYAGATGIWTGSVPSRAKHGIWSGRPNRALVDEAAGLPPGRVLDLGCGEGADALWLAERGWAVTALDISPTEVDRTGRAAGAAGLADSVSGVVADLAAPETWPDGPYDLVSACFLQSPLQFPRAEVLCRAASLVGPGGRLLVVAHAAAPPWADIPEELRDGFPTVERELADLALDETWEVEIAEVRGARGGRARRAARRPARHRDPGRASLVPRGGSV